MARLTADFDAHIAAAAVLGPQEVSLGTPTDAPTCDYVDVSKENKHLLNKNRVYDTMDASFLK